MIIFFGPCFEACFSLFDVRVQFVCIAQQDYCCILNQVELNTQRVEEEGEIVMVKEHRELDRTGTRKGHIVVKVPDIIHYSPFGSCTRV